MVYSTTTHKFSQTIGLTGKIVQTKGLSAAPLIRLARRVYCSVVKDRRLSLRGHQSLGLTLLVLHRAEPGAKGRATPIGVITKVKLSMNRDQLPMVLTN